MAAETVSNPPLPPGSAGLPGLGETLPFTRDTFAFIQARRARYGRVFRTNLLGRDTAMLIGPEPLAAFYDPANVERAGANPPSVQLLFGGSNVINALDGAAHAQRRRAVSAALSRDAVEAYLPTLSRYLDAGFKRWTNAGEIRWNDELKRLVIEALGTVFASIDSDAELTALVARCERVAAGFTALPIPLPGTRFTAGVRAKDEALAYYCRLARAHRDGSYDDALARILATRDDDGAMISDADAAGELHHLFLAGFIIFALFAATIVYLTDHPDVRERLAASVATLSAAPTTAELVTNAYLMQVVDEVRRLAPIVPVVFGRARRAFTVDGFTIPAGWRVAAAVWTHDREAASFADPERFDPDRFAAHATDTLDAYAYAPQGAGPADGHRCPGFDLTTVFMALFTAQLVRGLRWELPPQDLTPNWSLVPPVPRSGLRAIVRSAD